jgi:integrase
VARYRVTLDVGSYGRRKQKTTTWPTLRAAREYVNATKADLARGTYLEPDRQTFASHATAWLERKGRDVRPVTVAGYATVLTHALAAFGTKPLASVTRADIEAVVAKLDAAGRSRRTASLTLFVIRSVLAEALDDGLVVRNVAANVKPSGVKARPRDFLEGAELAKLRVHLASDRLFACWLLTLYGLRRSEVLGLKWTDIDLDNGTLTIARGRVSVDGQRADVTTPPKTARGGRTLPLPPDLLVPLRQLRQAQMEAYGFAQARDGYLAVDEVGEPIRPERWSDLWRRAVRDAGIEPGDRELSLHVARHSSVAALRRAGLPDRVVAEWHGHSEATMINIYGRHVQPNELADAGAALSAALA